MPKIKFTLLTLLCVVLTSCKTKEKHEFPLEKRYWDENDYKEVVFELNYAYDEDEKLPTFDNPQTKPIVEKLTDQQNFIVVLDDQELGLKYKNQIAEKFFKQWQEMSDIYSVTDRKDQYPYEKEFLAVWHFGLALQLKYFKLGNDYILESADDPNSIRVTNKVESNVKTLIRNYLIYLDLIDHEDTFTEEGKGILAEGIDKYFAQLLKLYPDSDYSEMKQKSESMLKKSESDQIKSSLNSLIETIDQFKKAA
ncbi:hypothetical protein K1F50_18525 [Muricauda oceani]|uniref:Lipoprotein n=1 Tax=Flagellimonas oceani TaxID=2698672 RepID=A0A6G7IZV5_9FLAO|nr:hypothetical protein [Allomuricauda oceani]MBW8244810.1 hypothetical protein [Allomuricauda oceani]QII43878.1 hypothetical protein GVT53_04035 [Allomuricauda oceani]